MLSNSALKELNRLARLADPAARVRWMPVYWRWVPVGMALGPLVFIRRDVGWAYALSVLAHELIHVRQCRRMAFGLSPWLSLLPFLLLYLLFPLPIGIALCRAQLEIEAYAAGWPHSRAAGVPREAYIDRCCAVLCSWRYLWPMPKTCVRGRLAGAIHWIEWKETGR